MVIGLSNPNLPARGNTTDPVNQYRDNRGILRYQSPRSLEAMVLWWITADLQEENNWPQLLWKWNQENSSTLANMKERDKYYAINNCTKYEVSMINCIVLFKAGFNVTNGATWNTGSKKKWLPIWKLGPCEPELIWHETAIRPHAYRKGAPTFLFYCHQSPYKLAAPVLHMIMTDILV